MDFKNANELLDLCKKHDLPISEVMRQREIIEGEKEADTVHDAMARVLEIMKNAAFTHKTIVKIRAIAVKKLMQNRINFFNSPCSFAPYR